METLRRLCLWPVRLSFSLSFLSGTNERAWILIRLLKDKNYPGFTQVGVGSLAASSSSVSH